MMPRRAGLALSAVLVLLLAGCVAPPRPPDKLTLSPASFADLPGWTDDRVGEAIPALLRSCAIFAKRPSDAVLNATLPEGNRVVDWHTACSEAARLPAGDDRAARAFFMLYFRPYRAANNAEPKGLFTGYYEMELSGARAKTAKFSVPIYGMPKDLVTADLSEFGIPRKTIVGRVVAGKFHPYPDRAAIDDGALGKNAPVIAWVDDPVDAFFLHIQGSGLIHLPNGGVMRVGYAAKNGQPYRAIGRALVDRGALAQADVSMQSIRTWLESNPSEARAVMTANPSYVFFRELKGASAREGPDGAMGIALTPGRSLAVDRRFVPLGVPVWLAAQNPDHPEDRTRRLLVAQDTGGAITGPVRGDVFWGTGGAAADRAGRMREFGEYFVLLPRSDAARLAQASLDKSDGR